MDFDKFELAALLVVQCYVSVVALSKSIEKVELKLLYTWHIYGLSCVFLAGLFY